jgi:hypothetical protein
LNRRAWGSIESVFSCKAGNDVVEKHAESAEESAAVVLPAGGVAGAAVLPVEPDDPAGPLRNAATPTSSAPRAEVVDPSAHPDPTPTGDPPMLKKIMEILTLKWLWDRHEKRKDN